MRTLLLIGALTTALAACAPATRVILLPQPGVAASAVEVAPRAANANAAPALIQQPYQSAAVSAQGAVQTEQLDARAVTERYRQLLSVQPPQRYTLFFTIGGTELTPESNAELTAILQNATARPGGEIVVTGHTDTTGGRESNDALSLQRARLIRALIIERGFDAARVHAVGRGEREPAVVTADEVDEPRNRRTEITVR